MKHNKYKVMVRQVVMYPVIVYAESEDDAVDAIHHTPTELTPFHMLVGDIPSSKWMVIGTGEQVSADHQSPTVIEPKVQPVDTDRLNKKMAEFSNWCSKNKPAEGYAFMAGFFNQVLFDVLRGDADLEEAIKRMDHTITKVRLDEVTS